jgi:DNA polymerase
MKPSSLLTQARKATDKKQREHLIRLHLGYKLRSDVKACVACPLHESSTQRVPADFPDSVTKTGVLFVGEAPGQQEDAAGKPFVGPAGRLFSEFLKVVGLRRSEVWVANVVCCRPPGNVFAKAVEAGAVSSCYQFLHRTIEMSGAWLIVAMGNNAYQALADPPEGAIGEVRGRPSMRANRVLLPTYHPAYALRTPAAKQLIVDDLRLMFPEKAVSSWTHLSRELSSCEPNERADYLALWYEARAFEEDITDGFQGRML